jgi:RimJ/RimL family protein N-acetyltransferase
METNYPIKVTLKGGKVLELRPLAAQDEQALIDFFKELPREDTQFLKDDVKDPEVVRRFVTELDLNKVWSIVALDGGKIVGDATLHMSQRGWRRHVGEVRVVVAHEFQKQRLATTLIHELVNQASVRELKQLEAQILDNQINARKAFEHLGFREEARLKDAAMDLDGNLRGLVIMTNTVDDLWHKMEEMISDMEISPDGY